MTTIVNQLTLETGPSEWISLTNAKEHTRSTGITAEDTLLTRLITATRKHTEKEIARGIGNQTWKWKLSSFPSDEIYFPLPPLKSLQTFTYKDIDGNVTTLYDATASPVVTSTIFGIETETEPGFLYLLPNQSWPTDSLYPGFPIELTFECGIQTVEEDLFAGMLLLLGHLFEHRETVVVGSVAQMNAIAAGELPLAYAALIDGYRYYDKAL